MSTRTHLEKEAKGNSKMAYLDTNFLDRDIWRQLLESFYFCLIVIKTNLLLLLAVFWNFKEIPKQDSELFVRDYTMT